jgi:hypothetical protein
MSRLGKIVVPLSFLLFIGYVVYNSMRLDLFSCEVCMEFGGGTKCASASGTTQMEARGTAINVACAALASGVTASMACGDTPPKTVSCTAN